MISVAIQGVRLTFQGPAKPQGYGRRVACTSIVLLISYRLCLM